MSEIVEKEAQYTSAHEQHNAHISMCPATFVAPKTETRNGCTLFLGWLGAILLFLNSLSLLASAVALCFISNYFFGSIDTEECELIIDRVFWNQDIASKENDVEMVMTMFAMLKENFETFKFSLVLTMVLLSISMLMYAAVFFILVRRAPTKENNRTPLILLGGHWVLALAGVFVLWYYLFRHFNVALHKFILPMIIQPVPVLIAWMLYKPYSEIAQVLLPRAPVPQSEY